ncbi:MAG: ABC transporter permease [Haloferacaceae archaeon]
MNDEESVRADDGDAADGYFGLERHTILSIVVFVTLVLSWELLSRVGYSDLSLIFPTLSTIIGEFVWLFTDGIIYYHLAVTLQEVLIAFVLAATIGVTVGTALGTNKFLAEGVEPVIYYVSTVPKLLLYPLIILVLGLGVESKVAMGFLSAIFPITVNTLTGALNVRENLVKVPRVYGVSSWKIFKTVYVPSMVTHIINGFRIGGGVAIIGTILGEHYASSTGGLGVIVLRFFTELNLARMYAVLLVIFVFSYTVNRGLLALQRYLGAQGYGTGTGRDDGEDFGF